MDIPLFFSILQLSFLIFGVFGQELNSTNATSNYTLPFAGPGMGILGLFSVIGGLFGGIGQALTTPFHQSDPTVSDAPTKQYGIFDEDGLLVQCKPGIGGDNCDRCLKGYYGLSPEGCKKCKCAGIGLKDPKRKTCDPNTGACECKAHVEGLQCDRCKPGYLALNGNNPLGCQPCNCNGQKCKMADGWYATNIASKFDKDSDGWAASTSENRMKSHHSNLSDFFADQESSGENEDLVLNWLETEEAIVVGPQKALNDTEDRPEILYFSAPAKYLGDQTASFNQRLTFKFRVEKSFTKASEDASPFHGDIYLNSEQTGKEIFFSIESQGNPHPNENFQEYSYHLHPALADPLFWHAYSLVDKMMAQFQPMYTSMGITVSPEMEVKRYSREFDFMKVLSNISSILIRATYSEGNRGYLKDFSLESASNKPQKSPKDPKKADWIGECQCENRLIGAHCERCEDGYILNDLSSSDGKCIEK